MFQSFKKWVKNEDVQQRPSPPGGMQLMHGDLQRKFAKGVQYNMKIVIRGDRNTGKSCLWHRLKGNNFKEEYLPTAEIQVSSIHWDYKATDDIVKVDVWDVVDQGKSKKKESKGLKLAETSPTSDLEDQVLDATFLDVYKHAHAVILIFDITKKWTFNYIERELPKVPNHIPTLVLANFRDMGDHRVITLDEVVGLVESMERPHGSASILVYESSMKNGFGLKYVHKFFNMPFLLVQRESLLKQLKTNHLDLESCLDELATEDYTYEEFLDRQQGCSNNKKTVMPINSQAAGASRSPSTLPGPLSPVQCLDDDVPKQLNLDTDAESAKRATPKLPSSTTNQNSKSAKVEENVETPRLSQSSKKSSFIGKLFRRSSSAEAPAPAEDITYKIEISKTEPNRKVASVDDFVPDDINADDFLNDTKESKTRELYDDSSDDDVDGGNPMVAGFQEDLDSDDDFGPSYGEKFSLASDSEPE